MRLEIFLLILGMALATFFTRFAAIAALRKFSFSKSMHRCLRFIPITVLSALIAPTILMPQGMVDFSPQNAYMPAAAITGIVAWKTGNIPLSALAGLICMMALRA
jgi:branched-subunit amino acid transport protein